MKVLSEEQIERALTVVTDEECGLGEYLASELSIENQQERLAFKKGFYACLDLTSGLFKKIDAGELKNV